jgi:hypothetical protein
VRLGLVAHATLSALSLYAVYLQRLGQGSSKDVGLLSGMHYVR